MSPEGRPRKSGLSKLYWCLGLVGIGVLVVFIVMPRRYEFHDIEFWRDRQMLKPLESLSMELVIDPQRAGRGSAFSLLIKNHGERDVDLTAELARVKNGELFVELLQTNELSRQHGLQFQTITRLRSDWYNSAYGHLSLREIPVIPGKSEVSVELTFRFGQSSLTRPPGVIWVKVTDSKLFDGIEEGLYKGLEVSLYSDEDPDRPIRVQGKVRRMHGLRCASFDLTKVKRSKACRLKPVGGYLASPPTAAQ